MTSSSPPTIKLSDPNASHLIVKACEEFGFFKLINPGVPVDVVTKLESHTIKFFSQPLADKDKEKERHFGYDSRSIGGHGDVGWLEYVVMPTQPNLNFCQYPPKFRCAIKKYVSWVKRMACELLEAMADGLEIQPRDVLSRLLMDEESDSLFRLNHYSQCPDLQTCGIGFGEHTNPQIISVLRANDSLGYEISLRDGRWVSVPPDEDSFFVNVGDCLQVMTNGRFPSVRHRVQANSVEPYKANGLTACHQSVRRERGRSTRSAAPTHKYK